MIKYIAKRVICLLFKAKNRSKAYIHISSTILGNCVFEGKNRIGAHNYLNTVKMGLFSNMGDRNQFSNTRIGRFCSFGSNISLINSDHPLDAVSTHHVFYKSADHRHSFNEDFQFDDHIVRDDGLSLLVGNDVWIGDHVIIKGGIHIADGAVVGMGAVVTKDVPPYAIVAGNPARIIRYRFEPSVIEQFLTTKWWDWPTDRIEEKAALFRNPDLFFSKLQRKEVNK
jgi:acetyltransferase-like isoleucine patch superfamily enzyme